jgi:hypothetical protein
MPQDDDLRVGDRVRGSWSGQPFNATVTNLYREDGELVGVGLLTDEPVTSATGRLVCGVDVMGPAMLSLSPDSPRPAGVELHNLLDRHIVTAPIADARAVTAALEGSDAVTILVPSEVDRTLREIAERNDVPVALVRDLYAEQMGNSPVAELIDASDPVSVEAATTGHLRQTPCGECWSSCPHPSHNDPETGETFRLPPV